MSDNVVELRPRNKAEPANPYGERPWQIPNDELVAVIDNHVTMHAQWMASDYHKHRSEAQLKLQEMEYDQYRAVLFHILTECRDGVSPMFRLLYDGFRLAREVEERCEWSDMNHHWVSTFKLMLSVLREARDSAIAEWVKQNWPEPPFAVGDKVEFSVEVCHPNVQSAEVIEVDHALGRCVVKYEWVTPGNESEISSGSSHVGYEHLQPRCQP